MADPTSFTPKTEKERKYKKEVPCRCDNSLDLRFASPPRSRRWKHTVDSDYTRWKCFHRSVAGARRVTSHSRCSLFKTLNAQTELVASTARKCWRGLEISAGRGLVGAEQERAQLHLPAATTGSLGPGERLRARGLLPCRRRWARARPPARCAESPQAKRGESAARTPTRTGPPAAAAPT